MSLRIAFCASKAPAAQEAYFRLITRYDSCDEVDADAIVALGGDGFMLQTLHRTKDLKAPVYGMNRGTVGFMMNDYQEDGLIERLTAAEEEEINPLVMHAESADGAIHEALAINEVSLLRQGPQAAKLQIAVDGKVRMEELVCDGAIVATPAGSTAYNFSAHGPILPIGSDVLALTGVAAFRPRRWRGALLKKNAEVVFTVTDHEKRPVMAEADGRSVRNVVRVTVRSEPTVRHHVLFDPGHGLEERLFREQFV